MESLYVLQLENNKWYVGKTNDVVTRFKQHQDGKGSAWTKLYKPLRIVGVRPLKDAHDETNTTKDLMKTYGIDNVRGGAYVQIILPDHAEKSLTQEIRGAVDACFNCGREGHFVTECPITFRESNREPKDKKVSKMPKPREENGICYRCGREGHYSPDCYARTHIRGYNLETLESDEDEEYECDNCSRTFTTHFGCMVHQRTCR
jgi:predicted GIY-YIG superfamily endonuclease